MIILGFVILRLTFHTKLGSISSGSSLFADVPLLGFLVFKGLKETTKKKTKTYLD